MKKQIICLLAGLGTLALNAQVLNSSFEELNQSGSIKNWGANLIFLVAIDTNGNQISDSLIIDNQLYFSTSDAHTGTKALEMRNAYFSESGEQLAGRANLTVNDSDYNAFTHLVSVPEKPQYFTFYYKFMPVHDDTAYALLRVLDINGYQIGEALVTIDEPATSYTFAAVPVYYTTSDSAAFVEIEFSTAKPGSQASYGTRFLVDDVDLHISSGINDRTNQSGSLFCFPNPASESITIALNDESFSKDTDIRLFDVYGRQVKVGAFSISGDMLRMDVSTVVSGSYTISISNGSYYRTTRFIK